MKHTPGPWINIGNGDIVAISENYCGGEKDIASVFLTSNDEDEWNARLIAAAPDLLEALKMTAQQLETDAIFMSLSGASGNHQAEVALVARAAIAKATGGEA